MKFITNYKEFDTGNDISILEYTSDTPIKSNERILLYLKKELIVLIITGDTCENFTYIKNSKRKS